ncbi:hypothetical protein V491_01772 [Pseudogymnoascus sp. VKM F-3775]|nr:hypothetical protein V491_01772 [Pseudogymnoascus sp. VKM F-3775]
MSSYDRNYTDWKSDHGQAPRWTIKNPGILPRNLPWITAVYCRRINIDAAQGMWWLTGKWKLEGPYQTNDDET